MKTCPYSTALESLKYYCSITPNHQEAQESITTLLNPTVFEDFGGRIFFSNLKLYTEKEIDNLDNYIEILNDTHLYSTEEFNKKF